MPWKDAKRGLDARLLLVVASVLLAALLCEAALRLLFPKYSVAAAGWMPSDNMRIFAPAPNTRDEARHPDTGRRHPFHHNNLGLRQHRNFSDADIFAATTAGVFGDSFVHMPWLDAPYVFTEPLDYLLNLDGNFSVLNFGVSAYGPAQSYFAYQSFHAREALDYVLFVYYGRNDLRELFNNRLFDLEDGELRQREVRGSAWWVPFASRLHLTYLTLDATGRLAPYIAAATVQLQADAHARLSVEPPLADLHFSLGVFEQLIRRWRREVEASGGKFFVVLLPTQPDYPLVRPLLEEAGAALVDLNACYKAHGDWWESPHLLDDEHWHDLAWRSCAGTGPCRSRYWRKSPYSFGSDGHWNELANRLAAACLDDRLRREAGLPALAEAVREAALGEYYAAFESPQLAAGGGSAGPPWQERRLPGRESIRRKYQSFGRVDARPLLSPAKLVVESNHYDVYLDMIPTGAGDRVVESNRNDVYLGGQRRMIFAKDCHAEADAAGLFAYATPVAGVAGSVHPQGRISARLRMIRRLQVQEGDKCLQIVSLPAFPISRLLVGQRSSTGELLWSSEIFLDQAAFEKTMEDALAAAGEPIIESDMDVHVHGRRVFYVSDDCQNTDGRTPFFLHVTPTRTADLAQDRIEHGYDNLDFHQAGTTVGARCVVLWELPDYPIRHIRTGQYVASMDGHDGNELLIHRLWEGEADIGE